MREGPMTTQPTRQDAIAAAETARREIEQRDRIMAVWPDLRRFLESLRDGENRRVAEDAEHFLSKTGEVR